MHVGTVQAEVRPVLFLVLVADWVCSLNGSRYVRYCQCLSIALLYKNGT